MRHCRTITATLAIAAGLGGTAAQAQTSDDRPVGSVTTFKTASGATSELHCTFSDDPRLDDECGRLAGDGDDILESMRARRAVSATTRVVYRDGSRSRVLTDLVTLDGSRTLLMQAVGVDNASVICRLDGGCASVRRRATKEALIRELRAERKLTARLKRSLEGEDPYVRD